MSNISEIKQSNCECLICYEINSNHIDLKCNSYVSHYICANCYKSYINYSLKCPICRADIKNISFIDKYQHLFNYNQLQNLMYKLLDITGYVVGCYLIYSCTKYFMIEFVDYVFSIINPEINC